MMCTSITASLSPKTSLRSTVRKSSSIADEPNMPACPKTDDANECPDWLNDQSERNLTSIGLVGLRDVDTILYSSDTLLSVQILSMVEPMINSTLSGLE